VRNFKGDIISKGTMYINKEQGYAVINDFELNERYRRPESSSRSHSIDETSPEELVFKAFQRGIMDFVEEYDKENPDRPLQQINVGMGYNRLKRQVERFKRSTSNLTVPSEYGFEDATKDFQYVLYQRAEKQIEMDDMIEDEFKSN